MVNLKNMKSNPLILIFIFFFTFFIHLYPYPLKSAPLINLEEMRQDFVLKTQRIKIPGHPHAFNASLIRWQDSLLMSFRVIPDPSNSFNSQIGLLWLDENFNPLSEPEFLNLREHSCVPCRAEDARLISIDGHLYMIYSDNVEIEISRGGFRVYLLEICLEGKKFTIKNRTCLSYFEGEDKKIREKNWVPFEYHKKLYLVYSLNPHRIFYPIPETEKCETLFSSYPGIEWNWGIPRGGTPALAINEYEYLAFFHSSVYTASIHSKGKTITHYFMGAYTFSIDPPFEITKISPEPIVGKGFYQGQIYKPYWKPVRVVFPCGFIFDEQYIWVTYGRQDHEVWVMKLDKNKLLQSLVSLSESFRE